MNHRRALVLLSRENHEEFAARDDNEPRLYYRPHLAIYGPDCVFENENRAGSKRKKAAEPLKAAGTRLPQSYLRFARIHVLFPPRLLDEILTP